MYTSGLDAIRHKIEAIYSLKRRYYRYDMQVFSPLCAVGTITFICSEFAFFFYFFGKTLLSYKLHSNYKLYSGIKATEYRVIQNSTGKRFESTRSRYQGTRAKGERRMENVR